MRVDRLPRDGNAVLGSVVGVPREFCMELQGSASIDIAVALAEQVMPVEI